MQDNDTIASYVDAAAALQDLALGTEQRLRVIENLARTAAIAAPLLEFALPPEVEAAAVFKAGV
jgi:hypothetical protein